MAKSTAGGFRQLHERAGAFVIPNPWDVGSARVLAAMGFEALATTSAGLAFSLGKRDGEVTPDEALEHCRTIVAATPLPVSADLEKGFGDTPEAVAETIEAAASTGLAGCSIEDYTPDDGGSLFELPLALERIEAAVEAKQRLDDDFVLTARCENFLRANPDLDDTIKRLQAFEEAGADVLYAPAIYDLEVIATVCESVSKPVNVVIGVPGLTYGVEALASAGVKRISTGSALARAALGAFVAAAREVREQETFRFADTAIGFAEIEAFFQRDTR